MISIPKLGKNRKYSICLISTGLHIVIAGRRHYTWSRNTAVLYSIHDTGLSNGKQPPVGVVNIWLQALMCLLEAHSKWETPQSCLSENEMLSFVVGWARMTWWIAPMGTGLGKYSGPSGYYIWDLCNFWRVCWVAPYWDDMGEINRQSGGWIGMKEGSLVGKLTIKTGVRSSCRAAKANSVFMVPCWRKHCIFTTGCS